MRFNQEKKNSIILYILEKINSGTDSLSRSVSEAFGVNQATIHTYITELIEQGIIKKTKRGQYELVDQVYDYCLEKKDWMFDIDTYVYDNYLSEHIKDLPENVKHIWNYVCSEMFNNVIEHSEAGKCNIRIIQNRLNTTMILDDDGIGIFKKIRDHFRLPTLEDAITELVKGKLTTDSNNHSGEGIFFSSKMMDDFYIVSEEKVFSINKYDDSKIFDGSYDNARGTTVIMRLSNNSKKTCKDIFDQYSDENSSFMKTRIPLASIYDSYPVSRSQAKRLCNRLEDFKEVVLDFADVDWMGQGFAHQLFVVFARDHQDVLLTPINMSEDVLKMYKHVKA